MVLYVYVCFTSSFTRKKIANLGGIINTMFEGITRVKPLDEGPAVESNLQRCLGVPDLTLLGVGGMVGSGVYVLVGVGARDQAGEPDNL